ncbi:hypothetical protein CSB37_03850 [bacterium DOLZORAL124_38_8]|nr:MAG: hypothetical protein CSB37_03850 [bacterium DOLZORAL124_38_8]
MVESFLFYLYAHGMKKLVFCLWSVLVFGQVLAFTDVNSNTPYVVEIKKLKSQGVLSGNPDGTFLPEKTINRIELVQILYKSGFFDGPCPYKPIRFTDTELNTWYTPALRKAVLCGGFTGYPDKSFRPASPLNFAEFATIVTRVKNKSYQKTNPWFQAGISFLQQQKITLNEHPTPETKINRAQAAYVLAHFFPNKKINKNDFSTLSRAKFLQEVKKQLGVVTKYDAGYYQGGFPPNDRGACTDVVERAVRTAGYEWKRRLDADMKRNPHLYPSKYDANINYRRVRNVKVFLDRYAKKLSLNDPYLPGDIVTYDQIPGGSWHIGVVSDNKTNDGTNTPLLLHNYARGVVEENSLHTWPAPKTGHYRLGDL